MRRLIARTVTFMTYRRCTASLSRLVAAVDHKSSARVTCRGRVCILAHQVKYILQATAQRVLERHVAVSAKASDCACLVCATTLLTLPQSNTENAKDFEVHVSVQTRHGNALPFRPDARGLLGSERENRSTFLEAHVKYYFTGE